jgi:hypothetical protein
MSEIDSVPSLRALLENRFSAPEVTKIVEDDIADEAWAEWTATLDADGVWAYLLEETKKSPIAGLTWQRKMFIWRDLEKEGYDLHKIPGLLPTVHLWKKIDAKATKLQKLEKKMKEPSGLGTVLMQAVCCEPESLIALYSSLRAKNFSTTANRRHEAMGVTYKKLIEEVGMLIEDLMMMMQDEALLVREEAAVKKVLKGKYNTPLVT